MEMRKRVIAIGALLAVVVHQQVFAQDVDAASQRGGEIPQDECTCMIPATRMGVGVGVVNAVRGEVLMSMPEGYSEAQQGAPIANGSRIVVGLNSSASLRFGVSCALVAPAGATVVVGPRQAGTCIAMHTIGAVGLVSALTALGSPASWTPVTVGLLSTTFAGALMAYDMGRQAPLSR